MLTLLKVIRLRQDVRRKPVTLRAEVLQLLQTLVDQTVLELLELVFRHLSNDLAQITKERVYSRLEVFRRALALDQDPVAKPGVAHFGTAEHYVA